MSIVEKSVSTKTTTTVSPWAAQVEKVTVQSMVVQQIKKKFWVKHLPKLVAYKAIVSDFPITMKKIQEIDLDPDAVSLFASETICHGIVQSSLVHELQVIHQAMSESLEPIKQQGTSQMIACMKSLHGHSCWRLIGLNPREHKEAFTTFVSQKIEAYCMEPKASAVDKHGGSPSPPVLDQRASGTTMDDDTAKPLETTSCHNLRKRPKVSTLTPALRMSTRGCKKKPRQQDYTAGSTTTTTTTTGNTNTNLPRVTPQKSRKTRVHFQKSDAGHHDESAAGSLFEKAETLALSLTDEQRVELCRVLHHTLSLDDQYTAMKEHILSFTPNHRLGWMKDVMLAMPDDEKERLWNEVVASIKIQFQK